jgi:hypothetical protein
MDHGIVEGGSPTRARSEWDCLPSDYIPIDHGIGPRLDCSRDCQRESRYESEFHTCVCLCELLLVLARSASCRLAGIVVVTGPRRFPTLNHARNFEIFLGRKEPTTLDPSLPMSFSTRIRRIASGGGSEEMGTVLPLLRPAGGHSRPIAPFFQLRHSGRWVTAQQSSATTRK